MAAQHQEEIGSRERRIASYSDYRDAERAVEDLADAGFPVGAVTIVGRGLRLVENVTRRYGFVSATADGAVTGGAVGASFAFLLGLFGPTSVASAAPLALWGLVFGAVLGAAIAATSRLAGRGPREFASTRALAAECYDLVVEKDLAARASSLLTRRSPNGDADRLL